MIGRKISRRLQQNYFAKSFLALLSGSVVAQLINLAFYPVISRIFSPRDFGDLAIFTSTISVLSSFTSGKYELAISTARTQQASRRIVQLATMISVLFSVLILVGVTIYLFAANKKQSLSSTQVSLLMLIPLSVIMINGYQILSYYFVKYKKLGLVFKTKLTQVLYKNATQVAGGLFFTNKVFFLGLGVIMSQSVGLFTLMKDYFRQGGTSARTLIPGKKERKLLYGYAIRHKKYPFYLMPSGLLNKVGIELPVFFITAFYSVTFTGYYSMANQLIAIPISIVIQSLAQTYLNEIAEKFRNAPQEALRFYKRFNLRLFKWTLLPCIAAALAIKPAAIFILGEKWRVSAEIMQYLCILSYFQLVYSTISQTLNIINKQEQQLIWNVFRVLAIGILFWISSRLHVKDIDLIKLFVLVMALFYLILGRITTVALQKAVSHE